MAGKIWKCKIGEVEEDDMPEGADRPMRQAVIEAYEELTGEAPRFAFTGWGGALSETEQKIIESR